MERLNISPRFALGSNLPDFSLPSTEGKEVISRELKGSKALLVIFTCNHCPYVKGTDAMLISVVQKFISDGLRVVAISSNDAVQYSEDSFENMQKKAKELKLPFAYLYDETQNVARLFDAQCTPECYIFDSSSKLVFHGTINDSPRDPTKVSKDYLSVAIAQVLEGQKPSPDYIKPIGCSIKWKNS